MFGTFQLSVLFSLGPAYSTRWISLLHLLNNPSVKAQQTYKGSCPVCSYLCRIKTCYEIVNVKKKRNFTRLWKPPASYICRGLRTHAKQKEPMDNGLLKWNAPGFTWWPDVATLNSSLCLIKNRILFLLKILPVPPGRHLFKKALLKSLLVFTHRSTSGRVN